MEIKSLSLFLVASLAVSLHANNLAVDMRPVPRGFKFYGTHIICGAIQCRGLVELSERFLPDDPIKQRQLAIAMMIISNYNLPQWVDSYVLNNGIERTRTQKCANVFFGWLANPFMDLKTKEQREAEQRQQAPSK